MPDWYDPYPEPEYHAAQVGLSWYGYTGQKRQGQVEQEDLDQKDAQSA
jgi:hypothetical protein